MKNQIKEHLRRLIFETPVTDERVEVDLSLIKIKKVIIKGITTFMPFYLGDRMGTFRIKPYKEGYRIYGVAVYTRYQNQGIAKRMYLYIIKSLGRDGKKLYSDAYFTDDAKRVWESLVRNGYAIRTDIGYMSK
jgi:GNAT superfamily N-acetyltransferase